MGEVSLPKGLRGDFDEETYAKTVSRVLDEIIAGNVYQADLTHRMDVACNEDAWGFYRRLRAVNPAPFGAFVELPEVAILSSSPERFLRATADGELESSPIKGTRRRGVDRRGRRAPGLGSRCFREGPRRKPDDRRPRSQ